MSAGALGALAAVVLLLAGCATGDGERAREGLVDRSVGRTGPRADGGAPVAGTLAPAPKVALEQRPTRRLQGPAEAGDAGSTGPAFVLDESLPRYRPGSNLHGEIRTVGSSTLTTLFSGWSEEFERIQARIRLRITGGGSAAAVGPFVAGESDLAPMAREMNGREIESFRRRWGYEPTRVTVALDAIAVYVNKDNPLRALTLPQLDAVFAIEPRRGEPIAQTWGALGVTGPLADAPIHRYGPRRSQGIHSVFRTLVLEGGDYTLAMRSEWVSSAVVQSAGADEAGIAFASRLFATQRTRAVAIAAAPGQPAWLPTAADIASGRYPLARRLYVYVNRSPTTGIPLHVAEFLRYVCSYEGQQRLAQDGGIAMTREISERECVAML